MGLRIIDRGPGPRDVAPEELAYLTELFYTKKLRLAESDSSHGKDQVGAFADKISAMRKRLTDPAHARSIAEKLEADIRSQSFDFTKTQIPVQPTTLLDLL